VQNIIKHRSQVIPKTKEYKRLVYDAYNIYKEFERGDIDIGWRENKDGSYEEWIDNDDAMKVFEDLYQVKEDLKAFMKSKAAKKD